MRNASYLILKIRVANSAAKKGKSGSFRVIAAANIDADELILLFVHPKTGPEGLSRVDNGYLKELLRTFKEERNANSLVKLNLNDDLKEIE